MTLRIGPILRIPPPGLPLPPRRASWSTFEDERRDALEGVLSALDRPAPDRSCIQAGLYLLNHLNRLAPRP